MALQLFDIKQFLIRKGERVALGVAVAVMATMIVVSILTTLLSGQSAAGNTRELKDLVSRVASATANSTPPTSLAELPADLRGAGRKTVDPEWFACTNLYFDHNRDIDRKWRAPLVLEPDEFAADVVRGAVPIRVLRKEDDGLFAVGMLQTENDELSDASRTKLQQEFKSFKKWDQLLKAIDRQGFRRGAGFGVGPGGAGISAGARTGRAAAGVPSAAGAGPWSRWGRGRSRGSWTTMLKWVKEDQLDKVQRLRPAQDIMPVRMVIVRGTFPYRRQLEEFRRALRFDSVEALLHDPGAIPEFLGILVQRREIQPDGTAGDWATLDIEGSVKQLRIRAVSLEPENPELEGFRVILQPNRLVMPRPKLIRGEKYPDLNLHGVGETLAKLEKSTAGDLPPPPPKSRFEDVDPWSDVQPDTRVADGRGTRGASALALAGMAPAIRRAGRDGGAGALPRSAGQDQPRAASAARASYALPDKCLFRFLDVTVQPGRTYEYRLKIRLANPAFGKEELAVSKETAAVRELQAPQWTQVTERVGDSERPRRVTVSDELLYYAMDEKIDRAPAANQERAAVQIHRWLEDVRVNPHDQSSVVPVGDWTVLERALIHRGEYIGGQQEVEIPVWRTAQNRFTLAAHADDDNQRAPGQSRPVKHKGVLVDFSTDPVWNQPSILVDFQGGKRTLELDGKVVTEESSEELLVLDADGKLVVRTSAKDAQDGGRRTRYAAWKSELTAVEQRDKRANGQRDDAFFRRRG
jgi:hypothetical protein